MCRMNLNNLSNGYRLCGSKGSLKKDASISPQSVQTIHMDKASQSESKWFKVQTLASTGNPVPLFSPFSISVMHQQSRSKYNLHTDGVLHVIMRVTNNPVTSKVIIIIIIQCSMIIQETTSLLHMLM